MTVCKGLFQFYFLFSDGPVLISREVPSDILRLPPISGPWDTPLFLCASSHRNADAHWSWWLLVHCSHLLTFCVLWGYFFFINIVMGFWFCCSKLLFLHAVRFYNKREVYSVSVFSWIYWAIIWLLSFTVFVLFIEWFFLKFYAHIHTYMHMYFQSVLVRLFQEFIHFII